MFFASGCGWPHGTLWSWQILRIRLIASATTGGIRFAQGAAASTTITLTWQREDEFNNFPPEILRAKEGEGVVKLRYPAEDVLFYLFASGDGSVVSRATSLMAPP